MLAHCTQRAFHVLRVHGLAARLLSPMSRRTLGDYLCFRTLCWVWSQHLLSNPVYVQSMNSPDFTLGEILPKNRRNQVAKEPLPCSIIPRILGCSDRFWEIFLNCSRTLATSTGSSMPICSQGTISQSFSWPCCASVLLPFFQLQIPHIVWQFEMLSLPPFDRG